MKQKFVAALLSVSDSCRVACGHCFRADKGRTSLTLETLERTLSRLREVGVEQVCFTGGEPLDHPDLGKFIRKGIQFGVRVSIITGRAASLVDRGMPDWLNRLESIGLSFDSNFLVDSGVSSRRVESAVSVARSMCSGPRPYLHGTCFNLTDDEMGLLREIRDEGIEITLSPALLQVRMREYLGYDTRRYLTQLASDLRLIQQVTGASEKLVNKFLWLITAHEKKSTDVCSSKRLYVSAAGYIRLCPYNRLGEISVFMPRAEIYQALTDAIEYPPAVSLGCMGGCGEHKNQT